MPTSRVPGLARVALAAIRIVNGSAALAAPALLARNLGVRRADNQAVQYVFRMFGIRTVVIGLQLLLPEGELRRASVRTALTIRCIRSRSPRPSLKPSRRSSPKPSPWKRIAILASGFVAMMYFA